VISATLPESRVTDFPTPASNRGVAPPPHVPRGARDSSTGLQVPQAEVAAVIAAGFGPECSGGSLDPRFSADIGRSDFIRTGSGDRASLSCGCGGHLLRRTVAGTPTHGGL
jgi:hypothetical protein